MRGTNRGVGRVRSCSHRRYYHCTRRRRGFTCTQGVVQLDALEAQIVEALERIRIPDDFRDWALHNLRVVHHDETSARQAVDQSLTTSYNDVKKQLDALLDLKLRGLVTDEEYATKRQKLVGDQIRLKERLEDTDSRATHWLELAERAFIFANEAKRRFEEGSLEEKREILATLGSNLVLKDRILRIQLQKPFRIIVEGIHAPVSQHAPFEPRVQAAPKGRNDDVSTLVLSWGAIVDRVRTFFEEHPTLIRWPRFCVVPQGVRVPGTGRAGEEG